MQSKDTVKLEDDLQEPFNAWQTAQTPETAGVLLKALDPVITSGLKSYGGATPSPMMRSHAKRIVLDSLPRYDSSKTKLKTFLSQQLQGLQRLRATEQNVIYEPELVRLNRQHIAESENELRDQLGRDPSMGELSAHTKLTPKRILKIRGTAGDVAESAMVPMDNEDAAGPAVAGNAADDKAWLEFVYHGLSPVDQLIVEHSTGLHGRRVVSNQQLAKLLRLSAAAVSQHKAKIQLILDERKTLGIS